MLTSFQKENPEKTYPFLEKYLLQTIKFKRLKL